jgi:NAD-dependent deacetylase sirtuin 5
VPAHLRAIAPAAKTYHLITQNVDRLSVAAMNSLAEHLAHEKGHTNRLNMDSVIEMHGRLFDVKCTYCNYCMEGISNLLCPSLGATDAQFDGY